MIPTKDSEKSEGKTPLFMCEECRETFHTMHNLNKHQTIHGKCITIQDMVEPRNNENVLSVSESESDTNVLSFSES